jgi:hypothetical protein
VFDVGDPLDFGILHVPRIEGYGTIRIGCK